MRSGKTSMKAFLEHSFFIGRTFVFSRTDGSVISKALILRANGKIDYHSHPNETSWDIVDSALVFKNGKNEPTTVFDKMRLSEVGFVLEGTFLFTDTPGPHHRLTAHVVENKPPAPIARDSQLNISTKNNVAVLVRSHKVDKKFDELIQKLEQSSTNYDVFPLVDETKGRPAITNDRVIWHSMKGCRDLGLTQPHQGYFLVFGDFPIYFAFLQIPQYRFYIMIEDDVDFTRPDGTFIRNLVDQLSTPQFGDADFIGLSLRPLNQNEKRYEACRKAFTDRYCYYSYFPFVVFSKRLAGYLFSQRLIEAARQPDEADVIHCETYAPSCGTAGGFRCLDLKSIMPGSYETATMSMQIGELAVGKPMGFTVNVNPCIEMIHPIYTPEEFIRRVYHKFIVLRQGDWKGLISFLERSKNELIPDAIISELHDKIPKEKMLG